MSDPEVMVNNTWATEEEYEAQIALPMHMDTLGLFDNGTVFAHGTACGIKYPPDQLIRSTNDPTAVTCPECQAAVGAG